MEQQIYDYLTRQATINALENLQVAFDAEQGILHIGSSEIEVADFVDTMVNFLSQLPDIGMSNTMLYEALYRTVRFYQYGE